MRTFASIPLYVVTPIVAVSVGCGSGPELVVERKGASNFGDRRYVACSAVTDTTAAHAAATSMTLMVVPLECATTASSGRGSSTCRLPKAFSLHASSSTLVTVVTVVPTVIDIIVERNLTSLFRSVHGINANSLPPTA
ncbi:hypothetical protein F4677DRAFT_302308 [Hypoxylon crocopeplum]|nr:hypothetical protein F4677DRAFT_302308 [Hypoxylon crocopeplum]